MVKEIDNSHLFTLKVRVSGGGLAIIRAFETQRPNRYGHTTIDLELRFKGMDIFPRGSMYIGIPGHKSIDGDYAKNAAIGAFTMNPREDRTFCEDMTSEQLAFLESFCDDLSMEAERRSGGKV